MAMGRKGLTRAGLEAGGTEVTSDLEAALAL